MITQSHLKCPSCRLYFSFQNTPKILKACSHTICLNCLKNIKCCPIDLVEINLNKWGLKSFLTNTNILEQIQKESDGNLKKNEQERFSFSMKKQAKSTKSEQNKLLSQSFDKKSWALCKTHIQKCNFICKQDFSIICSECLQQQPHNSHSYISYQELLKHLTKLTDNTYKIYEEINLCSEKITKRNIELFIESEMIRKKERQNFEVRNYFQSVIEKIRKHQRQLLERLELIFFLKIKKLKETIDLDGYKDKKQLWNQKLHELTSVIEQVYEWKGFEKAFDYLDKEMGLALMVDEGQELICQMITAREDVTNLLEKQTKELSCTFNHNFARVIEKLCIIKAELSNQSQSANNKATQSTHTKSFQITPILSQTISIPQKNQQQLPSHPSFQSPSHSPPPLSSSLSSEQDFLLDTSKSSFHHHQTLTKNQITFEENFSLVKNGLMNKKEQFTPILRKEQDSLSGIEDQSTIIHVKNAKGEKGNSVMIDGRSEDLTIEFRQSKRNISSSCHKIPASNSQQLSQTLIYTKQPRQRSPLKSILNTNSQSKQKKLDIPQKYLPVWQSAKYDKIQNIDLTGAELGGHTILILCNSLVNSQKIKSLKLIRNKLTDEVIEELITCVAKSNITSLNLSQNYLTEKALDVIEKTNLGNLKSLTLSLNKIVLRKVKDRIEKFRERGITLTV